MGRGAVGRRTGDQERQGGGDEDQVAHREGGEHEEAADHEWRHQPPWRRRSPPQPGRESGHDQEVGDRGGRLGHGLPLGRRQRDRRVPEAEDVGPDRRPERGREGDDGSGHQPHQCQQREAVSGDRVRKPSPSVQDEPDGRQGDQQEARDEAAVEVRPQPEQQGDPDQGPMEAALAGPERARAPRGEHAGRRGRRTPAA